MDSNAQLRRREPSEILKDFWGYDAFRPMQEEIIRSVIAGKDTLALLPTGGGKSICYQIPGLMKEGICLVISPLIALMKDQVEGLRRKNITAFALHSGLQRKEVINILKVAGASNCKFLFVSPERLETALFKEYLPGLDVNLIAVDEAHCISQWGYDFRPPYLRIATIREELTQVPILALTASATPIVQNDICEKLQFSDPNVFRQSFERPLLSYSVHQTDSKSARMVEILQKVPGSGIIYCRSRRRTKEISDLLKMHGIRADHYHAGLGPPERNDKQESWIRNEIGVMVCTNAFGMGIDKPDVRIVIHADVPDCLENYYQEAGRAGRDGKMAYAVLLFDKKDIVDSELVSMERFPPTQIIKEVYQAIANYFSIPSGSGEGQSFDFDLADFLKKFGLKSSPAVPALKLLEQEGFISFSDTVFQPPRLRFTTGKQELYAFELEHPALEPLIKALLRTYEGIFDQPVFISERVIAGLIKMSEQDVKARLLHLANFGIVRYEPVKEKPQLVILQERRKMADLMIDESSIRARRDMFRQRLDKMQAFVREEHDCRSRFIASYFGDDSVRACGVCDNCLKRKSTDLSKEEFAMLLEKIREVAGREPVTIRELVNRISNIRKEKLWKVIDFLQAENKLSLNKAGKVIVK